MTTPPGGRRPAVLGALVACLSVGAAALLGFMHANERSAPAGSGATGRSAVPASANAGAGLNAAANVRAASAATATVVSARRAPGTTGRPDTPAASTAPPAWPFWEFKLKEPIPPREPPLTPPSWRLIGAAQSGNAWQIVILRQSKPAPEYFSVGQSLPGGYLVEAITEEDVTLVHRGRRMIVAYIGSR